MAQAKTGTAATETAFSLDYDQIIPLDAEILAETGIKETYEELHPVLSQYLTAPAEIIESIDDELPKYSLACLGVNYEIYAPTLADSQGGAWGRAAHAFFSIINAQLADSDVKLYALNGGNDLAGIFLTEQQADSARKTLPNKTDWPYLPTPDHPWYGQAHD